jgi:hypothetical protein
MNGRIYDAQLGRFLQADPVIQARDNAQSWNAYTYVFNNPLAYTDPSGMISLRQALGIVVAVVGTVFAPQFASVWTKIGYAALIGAASGYVSTGTMQGALWGAFSAAAFAGVGAYFDSAGAGWAQAAEGSSGVFGGGLNAAGYGAKVLAHGITGGVMSKLQGGKFGHGFASAGVTQALSPGIDRIDAGNTGVSALRIAAAAVVGGTASTLSGGKFANGALTGAFSRAFNDELHSPSRQEMLGRRVGSANIKDYDRNDPTFHEYKFTSQLCSTGPGCDVDSLMWVGADSAPKFGSVSNGLNVLHMKNPILHSSYIARDGSFYMVNVTHWNHDFHAGAVVNRLFQSDSGVYLSTHGFGYSSSTAARVANYVVGYGYFSAWHSQSVSAAKIQTGQIKPLK